MPEPRYGSNQISDNLADDQDLDVRLTINMTKDDHADLLAYCKALDATMSDAVRRMMRYYLAAWDGSDQPPAPPAPPAPKKRFWIV